MLIVFLKALQPGLFDKLVPVTGGVTKEGVVRKPHFAIRHVRRPEAKPVQSPPKPVEHHVDDLFSHADRAAEHPAPAAAKPVEKPKAAPKPSDTLDLFGDQPAATAKPRLETAPAKPKRPKGDNVMRDGETPNKGDIVKFWIAPGKSGTMRVDWVSGELTGGEIIKPPRDRKLDSRFGAHKAGDKFDARTQHLELVQRAPADTPAGDPEADFTEWQDKFVDQIRQRSDADRNSRFDWDHDIFIADAVKSFGVRAGIGKAKRREINQQCEELIQSGKALDHKDRDLLRQYSGGGGFDSLWEYYTDAKVAAAMWYAIRRMGVREGTALEPSCGPGVFLDTAPPEMRVTGVELEPMSSKIGAALHPGHEVQCASLERFANTDQRQFDVVIGNPPFAKARGSLAKDDKQYIPTPQLYFVDTSLDKAKAGGIVALVLPTGVMENQDSRWVREHALRKAEFLGGIRMPNTAFEATHTNVTTDVLFFRKRPDDVAGALTAALKEGDGRPTKYHVTQDDLKKLGVWDEEFLAGSYFEGRGAGNVAGTVGTAMSQFGERYTVNGSMQGVPEAIAAFTPDNGPEEALSVAAILDATNADKHDAIRAGAVLRPYSGGKRGDTKFENGIEYILEGDPPRWHRVDEIAAATAVTDAQDVAQAIEQAMNGEDVADLAGKVKAYVETHGVPSKNAELQLAASRDKVLFRLIGAVKPDGSLSDLVSGRKAAKIESTFDAAVQSLAAEFGFFTPEQVAARWEGGAADAVLDHLYASPDFALDPASGKWATMDAYLSGELWPKLDAARAAVASADTKSEDKGKFERQAKALEETIDPKSLEDVECTVSAGFIPLDVVAAFFNARRDERIKESPSLAQHTQPLSLQFEDGVFSVKGGMYGDGKLLDTLLNRTGVKKDDQPTIDKWNKEFKDWLCTSEHRDSVEDIYNRKFRGFRQRDYSTEPFEIPGLAAGDIKPWIYSGIRQALETGGSILADDVGLGKTVQGLILARMAKVTGKAQRPMIIVPKQVLANWVAEAEKWFPGSKVLTIGETLSKDKNGKLKGRTDSPEERKRKFHDLTQNDYDFVLITQPTWNELDLDPETKAKYLDSDFWVQRGDKLEGKKGDARTKAIRAARDAYVQQKDKLDFDKRTDAIYFNELGVDMLIGDEMHAYKNLFNARNRFGENPKFLGAGTPSMRAQDMAFKSRWVRENHGGGNVYGLTATPTKNSPLEVYSMLAHIAPQAFDAIGIRNSEDFLDRFCEFTRENILTPQLDIKESLITSGFKNLDELREIMRRYINRRTADQVGLQLPRPDQVQHLVDMTAEQKALYEDLREAARRAATDKDATGQDNILSIMTRMGHVAMDLEMYDPAYAGARSPKYVEATKAIVDGAKEGGQVVFADNNLVHTKLAAALVKAGIPRDQIAIINAAETPSSTARQNICDAFNAGKLKVVIGNTGTMGEGLNLQKGTTDIHHMDLPWNPAAIQQRNGRGLRQGNTRESIRLHTYMAKGSFDGYRYQTLLAKRDWQDLLWNGGNRVDNQAVDKVSRDDMMVMLAPDPDAARKELETNKAAAQERFTAQKTKEATEEFNRFFDMRRSLNGLKNKGSPAAHRLQVRIDQMKTRLEANPHFKAKRALEATTPILVQPSTGESFEPGDAFEAGPDCRLGGGGKWVVTEVLPQVSHVKVRQYGAAKAATFTLELPDLAKGVTKIEYDPKAEEKQVADDLAAMAKEKLNAPISSFDDLRGLPSSAIQAAYEPLQRRIKEGTADYTFRRPYGSHTALVSPEGTPVAAESYEAKGMLDSHDVMLPTDEHRELATRAWIEDARAKSYRMDSGAGGRNSTPRLSTQYPGGYTQRTNRWGDIGKDLFGEGFETAARGRLEGEQYASARKAPTLTEAIKEMVPVHTDTYGTPTGFPKKALATLWAKAKQTGTLGAPMRDVLPQGVPAKLFGVESYNAQATTVEKALTDMAKKTFPDLAAAMMVGGGAGNPEDAVRAILTLPRAEDMAAPLEHVVAKNPHLADRPITEFGRIDGPTRAWDVHGSGASPGHPVHAKFGNDARSMTLRELADRLTAHDDERHAA